MHWLPVFWLGYWWPSIKGNGPEDITSLIVVSIAASFLVPRVRRWWRARAEAVRLADEVGAAVDVLVRVGPGVLGRVAGGDTEGEPLTEEPGVTVPDCEGVPDFEPEDEGVPLAVAEEEGVLVAVAETEEESEGEAEEEREGVGHV